mmetsp:Transcript_22478/g.46836  ORF Transcript_22478/g.46836 Transcript_22478/m.46836 type:complete len:261 (-) Transcript_22478:256-1038(-)
MVFLQSSRMLLRSSLAAKSPSIQQQLAVARPSWALSSVCYSTSAPVLDDDDEPILGQVKAWNRAKCYGHVRAENATPDAPDIFLHRSGIRSDLDREEFPFFPYVNIRERVRFRVRASEKGGFEAYDCTFADGRPIPPVRRGYLATRIASAKTKAAESILSKLDTDLTDEQKLAMFDESISTYRRLVADAEETITKIGLKVEDFPREDHFRQNDRKNNQRKKKQQQQPQEQASSTAAAAAADISDDPLDNLMQSLDEAKST